MNDLVVSPATSMLSIRCSSSVVPRVTETSAWVCPRVNTDDPWVRGSTPASIEIGRMVSRSRPSTRSLLSSTCFRITRYSMSSRWFEISRPRSG